MFESIFELVDDFEGRADAAIVDIVEFLLGWRRHSVLVDNSFNPLCLTLIEELD